MVNNACRDSFSVDPEHFVHFSWPMESVGLVAFVVFDRTTFLLETSLSMNEAWTDIPFFCRNSENSALVNTVALSDTRTSSIPSDENVFCRSSIVVDDVDEFAA